MENNTIPYRVGKWLPSDQKILNNWLADLADEVAVDPKPKRHSVITELQKLIESDPAIYAPFTMMFDQVPQKYKNSEYGREIQDYRQCLDMLNAIMTKAPTYNDTGCVGFPINAILDWAMGTEGGFAAFLNPVLNAQLKKMLVYWGDWLTTAESANVLENSNNPIDGIKNKRIKQYYWLSDKAMLAMANMMRQGRAPLTSAKEAREEFIDTFVCNSNEKHYGFKSWDDFFLREFKDGKRPIAQGDDVIVNACESAPYNIATGTQVQLRNKFWAKGQPYSLAHMLNDENRAKEFVGGTVYQAFLAAKSYHRWHSPVDGKVVSIENVDGTYYSETPVVGFDPAAPNESQGYISEAATRGIIFLDAQNPPIGSMAIVFIGMAEVSSCEFIVKAGDTVKKGDVIGQFHFGGSSHCLLFPPRVDVRFSLPEMPGLNAYNLFVNSELARARVKDKPK